MSVRPCCFQVAALVSSKEKAREPRLYVHCFENQSTLVYDFEKV